MEQGDGLVEQPEAAETPPGPPAVPGVQATQAQHPTWTVDEAIDDIGCGPYQLVMLCVTGLAWMGDAMEMMLLAFLGPAARCEWGLSSTQEAARICWKERERGERESGVSAGGDPGTKHRAQADTAAWRRGKQNDGTNWGAGYLPPP